LSDLPSEIALHIGAHKTATTHLQRSLVATQIAGVTCIGPRCLRGRGESLPERFGFPLDPNKGGAAPRSPADELAAMAQGARRLVISEENFAGKLHFGSGRLPRPIYPSARQRLDAFSQALQGTGAQLSLFLAVRDPVDYLTSVYGQILQSGQLFQPADFVRKNPVTCVDWAEYVWRLLAVAGVGRVFVWRFEDYSALFSKITQSLVGEVVPPVQDRPQARISQRALQALLDIGALIDDVPLKEAAAEFPVCQTNPPFEIYTCADHAQSSRQYRAQWDAIKTLPGVTALLPSSA